MLKKLLIFSFILIFLVIMAFIAFRSYTKSFSPTATEEIAEGDLTITIEYSRPYKKDRTIFGDIVPYDEVWRTGANEATIFTTSKDLFIKDKLLPKGSYSLWTVPNPESWQVIWNKETGQWGVDPLNDGKASRNAKDDQLEITTPVIPSSKVFEQFTIDIDKVKQDMSLVMMWDKTMIVIPMRVANP